MRRKRDLLSGLIFEDRGDESWTVAQARYDGVVAEFPDDDEPLSEEQVKLRSRRIYDVK